MDLAQFLGEHGANMTVHDEQGSTPLHQASLVEMWILYSSSLSTVPTCTQVICSRSDWQVAISAQIVSTLSPVFVVVEHLTLDYHEHRPSLDWHNEADRTQWTNFSGRSAS